MDSPYLRNKSAQYQQQQPIKPATSSNQNTGTKKPLDQDLEAGYARGREIFYDNPDMQDIRARRQDLAQGYDSKELGALRESARGELAGQRSQYLRQLTGNVGRAGVGGARAAAMKSAADQGFAKTRADQERKLTLDSAQLKRQGTSDLENFLMQQRFGELSTGLGYGQLGVAERTGAAQTAAAEAAARAANAKGPTTLANHAENNAMEYLINPYLGQTTFGLNVGGIETPRLF